MELVGAIEKLIGSYMDGVRGAAQQAVDRALARSAGAGRALRSRGKTACATSATRAGRRTAAELAEICDTLCDLVRARPGASMAELAGQMGAQALRLQRPMARLKSMGRVRSVGQRHLTRYYPTVVRAAAGRD